MTIAIHGYLSPRRRWAGLAAAISAILVAGGARAGDTPILNGLLGAVDPTQPLAAQAPAPLGIYGASLPGQGHFSFSLQPSYGYSSGSLVGTQSISAAEAAQTIKTTYSSASAFGKPVPVRNDPQDVRIWAEPLGVSYGLTDNVALTVGSVYLEKQQNVTVFKGTGTTSTVVEAVPSTHTQGIGDTALAGVWRVYRDSMNQVNVVIGVSLPTGSITANATSINNSGATVVKRAVYTEQLGSGTYDALPGIVYSGVLGPWSWGLAYRGRLPLGNNDQGYRWGSYNEGDLWGGYTWLPGVQTTLTAQGAVQGHILGYDPQILGYGPCSNPLWYGGERIDLLPGLTVSGRYIGLAAATASVAVDVPVYQNLNGLHTARDYGVMVGLSYRL